MGDVKTLLNIVWFVFAGFWLWQVRSLDEAIECELQFAEDVLRHF